jgi:hypothetical protein
MMSCTVITRATAYLRSESATTTRRLRLRQPPLDFAAGPQECQAASPQELEDAEDKAALADWRAREAAGQTSYVAHDEVLRRLGHSPMGHLTGVGCASAATG